MLDAQIVTIVKDVATAAGILIAGGWAAWRWSYGERQRKRREMASPDGELAVTEVDNGDGRVIVTLHARWRNRGPLPIVLCADDTRVEIFEVRNALFVGTLDLRDVVQSTFLLRADPWWRTYVMEPNTESIMQDHFILSTNVVYAFRYTLCLPPGSLPGEYATRHLVCVRDLLWRSAITTSARSEPPLIPIGEAQELPLSAP